MDSEPVFSHDGTHLAFRRASATSGSPAEDIVVVEANGSNPVVVTSVPIPGGPKRFEWAPDSKSLLVDASSRGAPASATIGDTTDELAVWRFDAKRHDTTAGPGGELHVLPQRVQAARWQGSPHRPPYRYRAAAACARPRIRPRDPSGDRGPERRPRRCALVARRHQVVYNAAPAPDPESQRLFIVNADGHRDDTRSRMAPALVRHRREPGRRTGAESRSSATSASDRTGSSGRPGSTRSTGKVTAPSARWPARFAPRRRIRTMTSCTHGEGLCHPDWSPDGDVGHRLPERGHRTPRR